MQELMSRHKAYALSPRDCLKTTLFQKWQRMVAPPGNIHKTIHLYYKIMLQFYFFSCKHSYIFAHLCFNYLTHFPRILYFHKNIDILLK